MSIRWRDPYLWPDADVLKNKLKIKDQGELNQYEANYFIFRRVLLKNNPIQGNFDLEHLKSIHHYFFQDVYSFAGQLRTINISKGEMFANGPDIERLSYYLFANLNKEKQLTGLLADQFAERAALYFNAINTIHPFREGNGRCQRAFIEQLARNAGHTLNLEAVSTQRTMIDASKQGFNQDIDGVVFFDTQRPTLFIEMFQKAINPQYVDIMIQARQAAEHDVRKPNLLPVLDGHSGLTVQGLVLAKNDMFTAQLHGLTYIAIHKNAALLEPLKLGKLAIVTYNNEAQAYVKHAGSPLVFPQPDRSKYQIEQAKTVTRFDTVYHGKLIYSDEQYLYQELEKNNILKHEKRLFSQDTLPNLGDFLTINYDQGKPQLVLHRDEPSFITEEENKFIDIILQYKKLKQEKEQCPYPSIQPLLNADLVAHTMTMRKDQALMNYIQLRFPKMMKNIKSISQSISQSQSLSIDLDR